MSNLKFGSIPAVEEVTGFPVYDLVDVPMGGDDTPLNLGTDGDTRLVWTRAGGLCIGSLSIYYDADHGLSGKTPVVKASDFPPEIQPMAARDDITNINLEVDWGGFAFVYETNPEVGENSMNTCAAYWSTAGGQLQDPVMIWAQDGSGFGIVVQDTAPVTFNGPGKLFANFIWEPRA